MKSFNKIFIPWNSHHLFYPTFALHPFDMGSKLKPHLNFSDDNFMIGISCHKIDYWMVWNINDKLKLKLTREPDLPVYNIDRQIALYYPLFCYSRPDEQLYFSLVPNHHPEGKLFPDQKSLDYFFLIKGIINAELKIKWISEIKKLPQVLIAHHLELKKLKNIQDFLTDHELHMTEITGKKKIRFEKN